MKRRSQTSKRGGPKFVQVGFLWAMTKTSSGFRVSAGLWISLWRRKTLKQEGIATVLAGWGMSVSINSLQAIGTNANRSQMSHGQRFQIKAYRYRERTA